MNSVLITGVAGFIGSSLAKKLIHKNISVLGIDNFAQNYPQKYKENNINSLRNNPLFTFLEIDIRDQKKVKQLFSENEIDCVYHLAALPGIRPSLQQPKLYFEVNVEGTHNIFSHAQMKKVKKFVFSSSSSVYGNTDIFPFEESMTDLHPASPYAETKYEAEKLLFKQKNTHTQIIIFRLFSVYGPHGRPDMAPALFTKSAIEEKPISIFGDGSQSRDFTYVDDVIDAFIKAKNYLGNNFEIFNIGNEKIVTINNLIAIVEELTNKKLAIKYKTWNIHEAKKTYSDSRKAHQLLKWKAKTSFEKGMEKFYSWFISSKLN